MKIDRKRTKPISGYFSFFIMISLTLTLLSCEGKPEPFSSEGISTYSEATEWVKKNCEGETVHPGSSKIHKMVYFPKGKFMLIHFKSNKSKGYLYHQVSSSLWKDFKTTSDVDHFYKSRIKGNETIYLKLNS